MDLKSLDYDKVKCILEFKPANRLNPPMDILFTTLSDYDYYLENTKMGQVFIPCYKGIGKWDEDVYLEESVRPGQIEIPGNDDRKRIPFKVYGCFITGREYYPSFYGYFDNIYDANREFARKLLPWLEKTIVITERINNFPTLLEKLRKTRFKMPGEQDA